MEIIKFQNSKKMNLSGILSIIIGLLLFYYLLQGYVPLIISLMMIGLVFYQIKIIKLSNREIEELIISPEQIKIYLFNKNKPPVILKKQELFFDIEKAKINFLNSTTKNIIATANKNQLMDTSQWEIICNFIKQ